YVDESDLEVTLPLQTEKSWGELNDWLKHSDNRMKLIKFLKGIGGHDVENFI
ncbi:unnamed protein product, partial [Allacma fusca]